MQNKKILFLSSGLLTLIILIFVLYNITNINNNPIIIGKISKIEYHHNNTISLMYETGLDTEEYEKSTSNTWPGDDYIFNSALSGCENGGKLSWNQQTNKITLLNNTSDRCYIYFDVYNKAVINNVTNSVTTDSITVNVSAKPQVPVTAVLRTPFPGYSAGSSASSPKSRSAPISCIFRVRRFMRCSSDCSRIKSLIVLAFLIC